MTFSLTYSICTRITSVGLGDALQPDEPHVEDHERRPHEGQAEDVYPVPPQDVAAGQGADVAEQQGRELVHDERRGPRQVDPDVRSARAQGAGRAPDAG